MMLSNLARSEAGERAFAFDGDRPPPILLPLTGPAAQGPGLITAVAPVTASAAGAEVTFLTGVNAAGQVATPSFGGWNYDSPATYDASAVYAYKWAGGAAGTSGGTVAYAFQASSSFTTAERAALTSGLALWSAIANISFVEASSVGAAQLVFKRGTDGSAYEQDNAGPHAAGSTVLGAPTSASISIDTTVPGFGPLGGPFTDFGGYPWGTLVHEEGHALGLGHGGPYNGDVDPTKDQFSSFDSLLYSVMSYISPMDTTAKYYQAGVAWGSDLGPTAPGGGQYRVENTPTTPQMLDILAVQRLYGLPLTTPFDGGEVFGFNTNIVGQTRNFFDFTLNRTPVVTIWDAGAGNTLDLSGFDTNSVISLLPGTFSSAGRATYQNTPMINNIGIALNTHIETGIGGTGNDTITAADWASHLVGNGGDDVLTGGAAGDLLEGGAGNDTLNGGFGADVLYGNQDNDILFGNQDNDVLYGGQGNDVAYGGQGNDVLFGNLGDDALYGNLGDDVLNGGAGTNRLDGGDGADTASYADAAAGVTVSLLLTGAQATGISSDTLVGIENLTGSASADALTGDANANVLTGGAGADVLSGGVGADVLYGNTDNDVLYGNQDNDTLYGGQGDDVLYGGQGDDVLVGGLGADQLYGGLGSDRFVYTQAADSTPIAFDTIFDFTTGQDKVDLRLVHTGGAGDVFSVTASGGNTIITVDLGNNGSVDMKILVVGTATTADVLWT